MLKSAMTRRRTAAAALALGAFVAGGVATAGTASAGAMPGHTVSAAGAHAGLPAGTSSETGPVPGGVAGPGVAAVAPDGTAISGFQVTPWESLARRSTSDRGLRSADGVGAAGAVSVDILAHGARLRASVPSGKVIAYGYPSTNAWAGCKIRGSDGHIWGWLSINTSAGWRSGWMRGDLWEPTQHTAPGGGGTGVVPWC